MTTSPASSAASSAPSVSQSSGPAQGGAGAAPGQGGQEPGFDVQKAWKEARTAREEAGKLKDVFQKKFEGFDEDRDTIRRMKEVFSPKEEKKAPDLSETLEGGLDYILEQAMEMKQRGTPIPLTTKVAVDLYQATLAQQKTIQALQKQLEDVSNGVKQANDPEAPVNNMAYAQMETFMQSSIDALYGNDASQQGVKGQIYDAAVRMIQAHLKELQTKAPQEWDRARRNPQQLQSIVNAAIKRLVPPRAYSLIEEEQIKSTPMQEGELWAAWRELQAQKGKMSPEKYRDLAANIRRDILDAQARGRAKRR